MSSLSGEPTLTRQFSWHGFGQTEFEGHCDSKGISFVVLHPWLVELHADQGISEE